MSFKKEGFFIFILLIFDSTVKTLETGAFAFVEQDEAEKEIR